MRVAAYYSGTHNAYQAENPWGTHRACDPGWCIDWVLCSGMAWDQSLVRSHQDTTYNNYSQTNTTRNANTTCQLLLCDALLIDTYYGAFDREKGFTDWNLLNKGLSVYDCMCRLILGPETQWNMSIACMQSNRFIDMEHLQDGPGLHNNYQYIHVIPFAVVSKFIVIETEEDTQWMWPQYKLCSHWAYWLKDCIMARK